MLLPEKQFRNLLNLARGQLLTHYLRFHRCKVGSRLKCKQLPTFRQVPNGNIEFGDAVTIGFRITLDVADVGRVALGDHVNLTQDIIISSNTNVEIGRYTQIAEFVSVRDSDHGTRRNQYIALQTPDSLPISIGEDVWLGAGVRVLKGANVPDGAVIGAHSVILARSTLRKYGIYVGTPPRFVRERTD